MKRISIWAGNHFRTARILVICIKFILATLAYYTGLALYKMEFILPANAIYLGSLLVLIIIAVVYPTRKKITLSKKLIYLKEKTCNIVLAACSFLTIAAAVNNGDMVNLYSRAFSSAVIKHPPTAQEILNSLSTRSKEALSRKEKRILKKEFYKQLKVFAAAKITGDKQKAGEAWKIILAIIGAVGLLFLLAALVCSLSCNGSDAAAIIIGVLGLAGIIWAVLALIRRIKRGPKQTGKD